MVQVLDRAAEYDLRAIQDGTSSSFYVLFVIDTDGVWRLRALLSVRGLSILAIVMLSMCAGPAVEGQERPPMPGGPYRGTVVHDRTGQPVPDAVVVLLWQRSDDQIPGLMRLAGAKETVTDAKGQFLLDVAAVEQRLPRGTFSPRVLIFRPGYAPFPRTLERTPPGAAASPFSEPAA